MAYTSATTAAGGPRARTQSTRGTRALLACGVTAGPLFCAVALAQAVTRSGFDTRVHPLSLLSLGPLGWIQITNFVLAGALVLASAFGLRRALHPGRTSTWGPRLIATYGAALIWAGMFLPDPADGYPAGSQTPGQPSWHGVLHTIGPVVASLALIAACVVFARRFLAKRRRGWAVYCVLTALVSLVLTSAATPADDFRLMFAGGVVTWLWASVITAHVRGTLRPRPTTIATTPHATSTTRGRRGR